MNGELLHRLGLIDGHALTIPAGRLNGLLNNPRVKSVVLDEPTKLSLLDTSLSANTLTTTSTAGTKPPYSHPSAPTYNQAVLDTLHRSGIDGSGVGVAVIDSGFTSHPDLQPELALSVVWKDRRKRNNQIDEYGHGNHVATIVGGNGGAPSGMYRGVAPGAKRVGDWRRQRVRLPRHRPER